jgi:hypothetical protein
VLSGKDVTDKCLKFLQDHPDQVSQPVQQGAAYAEKFRETSSYDHQWPTAYGMERIPCASFAAGNCQAPQALPKDKWDAAWAESKKTVSDYFALKQ